MEPLNGFSKDIGDATKAARAFDEESDALDAAHHKYLSLSRDASVETRAYSHGELCDKAAGVALSLHDARSSLREACESQRVVPPRALSELLVAQLAYHQSCTRLLTSVMPHVSELLTSADTNQRSLEGRREASKAVRASMPHPIVREGKTLLEGYLFKGSFNLSNEPESVKGQFAKLKPWNKRWFALCDDGKLFYYKQPEDAKQAKVPIDMNTLTAVSAVNGPLELELKVGRRTLRLKAADTVERDRWKAALTRYMESHTEEREAAAALHQRRYMQFGTGVRDLDQKAAIHTRISIDGWLYKQDTDMLRRWRKWWCSVDGSELTCTLYESLKVGDGGREMSSGRLGSAGKASSSTSRTPRDSTDTANGWWRQW